MIYDKEFFKKHQNQFLWLANFRWTRWILGIHKLRDELRNWRIVKITPNSIHRIEEDGRMHGAFFTGPVFAESLAFNFSPFIYLQKQRSYRFSPMGVIGLLACLFVPKVGFLGFIGTTTDFNPNAGGDGEVNAGKATLALARAASPGDSAGGSAAEDSIGRYVAATRYIYRAFFPVDTSGIGSGSTISSATWNVYCTIINSTPVLGLISTTQASGTALVVADYTALTLNTPPEGITRYSAVAATWGQSNLNATGLSWINKIGYTFLGMREADEIDNSMTDTTKYANVYFENNATNKPFLEVIYTGGTAINPTVSYSPTASTGAGGTMGA